MIKFTAALTTGTLYGFGLSEGNLNRLEFNNEPIFFSFDYAGHSNLFGLILCMTDFATPADIAQNSEAVERLCLPFLDTNHGVTFDTLRVFPMSKSVMDKFRSTPFWALEAHIEITSPNDKQMFFAGRTEQEIAEYFQRAGLVSPKTKRTYKGFGKDA